MFRALLSENVLGLQCPPKGGNNGDDEHGQHSNLDYCVCKLSQAGLATATASASIRV